MRLELATGTTAALAARVLRGELDAAFIAEPFSARNLAAEPAFVEELVLITPKGHSRVATPKDLHQPTILAFATGCAYRRRLEAWLGRSSMVAERIMEYGSYHAIVACAAAGCGIAVVPRSVLRASGMEAQLAVHSAAGEDRQRAHHARAAPRLPVERARCPAQRAAVRIYGIDFTCAPRRAKAITVAAASLKKNCLVIENVERLESFTAFETFLARPGPWIGGFDFPVQPAARAGARPRLAGGMAGAGGALRRHGPAALCAPC